jgi:radical SAM enzyme (TIGR01210 family)
MRSLLSEDEKVAGLLGGQRFWFDRHEGRMVTAATAYIPYGCPDWGAPNGKRKPQLCPFCVLPDLAIGFQEKYFDGKMSAEEQMDLFRRVLAAIVSQVPALHTLMVFNAGSFFAMPISLQEGIMRLIVSSGVVRHVVVESRSGLITAATLGPMLEALGGVRLTVRIGVETKDHHLRTKMLPKGQSYDQLLAASAEMRKRGVGSGGYVMLNPAPGLSREQAMQEARSTISWILDEGEGDLALQEVYFCAACVEPGTLLEKSWREGAFQPARLWDVFDVLKWAVGKYGPRVHLLPFEDALPYVAVPSNHVRQGIPQSLEGAQGCDLEFHRMLQSYRETMDSAALVPPDCSCRPQQVPSE